MDASKVVNQYPNLAKIFEIAGISLDILGIENPYLDASNEGIYGEHTNRIERFITEVVKKTGETKESVLDKINKHIEKVTTELSSTTNPFTKSNVKRGVDRYTGAQIFKVKQLKESSTSEKARKNWSKKWDTQKENSTRNISLAQRAVNNKLGARNNIKTRIKFSKNFFYS